MVIEFVTDATDSATGFHAVYEQRTYQPSEEIPPILDSHSGTVIYLKVNGEKECLFNYHSHIIGGGLNHQLKLESGYEYPVWKVMTFC